MPGKTGKGGGLAPGVSGLGSKKTPAKGRAREKAKKIARSASSGSVFVELGDAEYRGGESTETFKRLKKIRRILEKREEPIPLAELARRVGGEDPKEQKRIRATIQDLIEQGVLSRTG